MSTEGGLFRYDGDRFQPFRAYAGAKTGYTYSLHSSPDGQFWTASSAGLFRLTGDRLVVVPGFESEQLEGGQSIGSDATNVYVATPRGLRAMNLYGRGQVRLLSPRQSHSVLVASDHTIWFGCGNRLCSMQAGREQEWGAERGVSAGPWNSIAEDSGGRLWIRSSDRVLVRESTSTAFHAVGNLPALNSSRGSLLVSNSCGQVMIPHNAGLMICDAEQCRNSGPESGLPRTEVLTALEDREGSLWLGYSGRGLARQLGGNQWQSFTEEEGLGSPGIWRIVRDIAGDLWIGTSRGLFHGSYTAGRWRFRRSDAVGELTVYGLVADPDGSLWIGTFQPGENGLVRYNPRTHEKVVYRVSPRSTGFSITQLSRDDTGTIWVAGRRGVMRLLPGGTRLEPVPLPVDGAAITEIRSTNRGLYVAGRKGLYIQQGAVRRLLTAADGLKDDFVQSLSVGPDGALWIAYFSPSGITRIEVNGGKVELRHLTSDEGLPGNVVYSQFFDALGRHWLGTDNGVAVLDGERWRHYDVSDGLVWNDCNAHSYLTEPDSTVWVGTSAGLARYHPAGRSKSVLPDTLITSVLRNDVPSAGADFDSTTRSLALRFTVLSYQDQTPRFRYRIGAGSSPWVQTKTHEVRFAELPSGSYRFEVQGGTEAGEWSHPAVLNFRIHSPWYLSWPCQVGSLLLLGALVWFWWRQREIRQSTLRATLEAAVAERTRDLAEATKRAEQANNSKSQFLANMSHEIRTPMHGVLGMARLALDSKTLPESSEHVETLCGTAEGLLHVINDILDFSKIEAGKMPLEHIPFSLPRMLDDLRKLISPRAGAKGVDLQCQAAESVPTVIVGDPARLRQVLMNLLGNAVKFTSNGSVTLEVVQTASDPVDRRCELHFRVRDTGVGIPKEQQQTIFEAFGQADSSVTRRFGGTGLGLTICSQLVQLMGGHIWVESAPGVGSTFQFTCSVGIAGPECLAERTVDIVEEEQHGLRVLLAEDNPVNQRVATAMLRKHAHQVTVVSTGVDAVEAWEAGEFDVILTDNQMPKMGGLEAVRCIRECEIATGRRRTRVVALSASAMIGDRERFLSAGMDAFLAKPFSAAELYSVLRQVMEPRPAAEPRWETKD